MSGKRELIVPASPGMPQGKRQLSQSYESSGESLDGSLRGPKEPTDEMYIVKGSEGAVQTKAGANQKKASKKKGKKEIAREKRAKSHATALFKSGLEYIKQRRYDEAIKAYSDIIRIDQKAAGAYYNRAMAYHYNRQYRSAISDYTKAIELEPKSGSTYYNRAVSYHYQGEHNNANVDYGKAIALNPKDVDAYWNRGVLLSSQGKEGLAADDFCRAIDMAPPATIVRAKN